MCKTADGTIDGTGKVIGDPKADHRNADGYVLDGPEFLTVFDGLTGKALATADYVPPRGNVADWGDDYGNRVDRFLACVAYLDGERPERRLLPRLLHPGRPRRLGLARRQADPALDVRQRRRHARATGRTAGRATTASASATWTATAGTRSSTGRACIGGDGKGRVLDRPRPRRRAALRRPRPGPAGAGGVQGQRGQREQGRHPAPRRPDRAAGLGRRLDRPAGVGRACALDIDPRHRGVRDVGARARASAGCSTRRARRSPSRQPRVVQHRRAGGTATCSASCSTA